MPRRGFSPEIEAQIIIAQWLDARGVAWFHGGTGEHRAKAVAAKLKAMGLKAGVPDVVIVQPPPTWQGIDGYLRAEMAGCLVHYDSHRTGPIGVALELKVCRGNAKPSPVQKAWLERMAEYGWATACVNGVIEALRILRAAGY